MKWEDTTRADGKPLPDGVKLLYYSVYVQQSALHNKPAAEYEALNREITISDLGHGVSYQVKVKVGSDQWTLMD